MFYPKILYDFGIYGGAQGIWVDKARTGKLAENGYGVTVSLTHSGKSYSDDLLEDGVIYHYPDTHRTPRRDVSEIEATKNAGRLGLPVFVITHTSHSKRDVFIGWITCPGYLDYPFGKQALRSCLSCSFPLPSTSDLLKDSCFPN